MTETNFISMHVMARQLGVPVTWLRAEACAGRLPYLKVGRRLLFAPETIERLLRDRADGNANAHGEAGEVPGK